MSSTNRGGKRSPADYYPTPAWCVHRLLDERLFLPGKHWHEPCAGDGAIIRAVNERREVEWSATELREECRADLEPLTPRGLTIGDFTQAAYPPAKYDVIITNPPFSIARQIIEASLERALVVVALLRLNFLASEKRADLMRTNAPDVYVLPNRPSFTGEGTDSIEYAWFVWGSHRRRNWGFVKVLAPTPAAERRASR